MNRSPRPLLTPLLVLLLLLAMAPVTLAAPLMQDGTSYVVQAGDTLSAIAARTGVSVQAIMAANGLDDPSLIRSGQKLVIPNAPALTETDSEEHQVARGETLSGIAALYGVSVVALAEANGIANPSFLRVGQRLSIPAVAQTVQVETIDGDGAAAAQAASEAKSVVYLVRAGDTLSAIAKRYEATVADIAAANQLTDPSRIAPGQQLAIPQSGVLEVSPQSGLNMVVSVSQQRCWVYQDKDLLYDWTCSTGRPGTGTRTGTFYVQSKIREAWGSAWGFYMPHWLGIYWAGATENGIHGLPYAPGGYPIWGNALGTPITYGCVLLGSDEARILWDMAYIGMPVTIQH